MPGDAQPAKHDAGHDFLGADLTGQTYELDLVAG